MHINIKIYTLAHIYAYAFLPHWRREISITLKILTECLGGFRLDRRRFYGWVKLWKLWGGNDRIKYGSVEYRDISCSLLQETNYWSAQASPGIQYTTYMHTYMHYTYSNNKKQSFTELRNLATMLWGKRLLKVIFVCYYLLQVSLIINTY